MGLIRTRGNKLFLFPNQLHSVSRTQQGRQREHSNETFRSPLSTEIFEDCVLSGGTRRRTFALVPERSYENISTIYFLEWESNSQPSRFSHTLVPLGHDCLYRFYSYRLQIQIIFNDIYVCKAFLYIILSYMKRNYFTSIRLEYKQNLSLAEK